MILILALYALFGFSFTLAKIILFFGSPFYAIGIRMILGGLGLGLFLYLSKSNTYWAQYRQLYKNWPAFLEVTLFGVAIPYCLRAWGLTHISSTKAAFLFTLMPLFTALFSYVLYKEKLSFQKSAGLMLGFLGMMPTLFTSSTQENLTGSIAFLSFPELAMLGAVASLGYNFIALRKLVKVHGCPAPLANAITMFSGGIISLNLALVAEPVWIYKAPGIFFALLAIQIVNNNFICGNLQANLLKTYSPTFMSFASFLTPICAAFFGWILLGEDLHYQYLISLAIVMIGLGIYYYDEISSQKVL